MADEESAKKDEKTEDAKPQGDGKAVANGSDVAVHYTGTLKENGEQFDSSEGKDPLRFKVGEGKVIKGFENGLIGMKPGDKKKIDIPSAEAYGPYDEKLVQKIPKSSMPQGQELQVGMFVQLQSPTGQAMIARIAEISDEEVTLDLNHPLAGKDLVFELEVVEVS